jgi:hypothetical protein
MLAPRRKLIHQFVEKDKKLQTMTIGKGDMKRVVISLAGTKPQPRPQNRNYRPRRRTENEQK